MIVVTIYRTRFREEDIFEGDFPRDDTCEEIYEGNAVEMARVIRNEGLTFEHSRWAYQIDGTRIVDYGEGIREEVSAHLSDDLNPRLAAAIRAAVDQ